MVNRRLAESQSFTMRSQYHAGFVEPGDTRHPKKVGFSDLRMGRPLKLAKLLASTLIGAFLVGCEPPTDTDAQAAEALEHVYELDENDYQSVIKALRDVNPEHPLLQHEVSRARSAALFGIGDFDSARTEIEGAIDVAPNVLDDYIMLAKIHLANGMTRLARESLEKAKQDVWELRGFEIDDVSQIGMSRTSPSEIEYFLLLASVYESEGSVDKAFEAAKTGLVRNSSSASLLERAIELLEESGDIAEAERYRANVCPYILAEETSACAGQARGRREHGRPYEPKVMNIVLCPADVKSVSVYENDYGFPSIRFSIASETQDRLRKQIESWAGELVSFTDKQGARLTEYHVRILDPVIEEIGIQGLASIEQAKAIERYFRGNECVFKHSQSSSDDSLSQRMTDCGLFC